MWTARRSESWSMSKRAVRPLRMLARISFGLIAFVISLLVVTTIYEAVATANERVRFPPPGRLVDVGGYRLHLRCEGQGTPTVVLESGGGMTSNEWTPVQPELARFTRVCSYERPGLGWSESGPPADPVEVLHVLLRNSAINGPYAIVGHSYGSGLALRFAYRFRNEVKGMVLTAASYPDEEVQRITADTSARSRSYSEIYVWSTRFGLMRITPERYLPEMLRVYFGLLRQYLPPKAAECEIAFLHQTRHVQSFMLETGHPTPKEEIEEVAACARGFGDMPLVVLSEKWVYSPAVSEQEKEEARREDERQIRLAGLSTRGQKIDLESGHLIPLEKSSAVVDAVRRVVFTARSAQ
jgi:pimeloyl-ACP methyl ester carboxylesterase